MKKELILIRLIQIYINLKMNFNLNKNLILIKVYKQEKELLVQLKNVKVNLINHIMQLNELNNLMINQILKKFILDYKSKI